MKSRVWYYGSSMTAYTLVVIGLFGLVNYFSAMHYKRLDLTASGKYSLSPQTAKMLERLPYDITAIAFVKDDDAARMKPKRILEQYSYHSSRFKWEFSDPDKQPGVARNHNITQYNTFVLIGRGGKKESITGECNEEKLTNAIMRLISTKKHTIYFTKGHGEKDINSREPRGYDALQTALKEQDYKVEEILLYASPIPEDASAVVVAGPEKELPDAEREKLGNYLRAGGKLLLMVDPFTLKETAAWLENFGVKLDNGAIVDKTSRTLGGDVLAPAVVNYGSHPITRDFRLMTFYPLARSMKPKSKPADGVNAFALAKTRADTWSKSNTADLKKGLVEYREGEDIPGPLTIAAGAEITKPGKEDGAKPVKGALLVVGDSDFAANAYLGIGGNRDFALNSLNWLAAEEDRITIGSRNQEIEPIIFSVTQISAIAGFSALGLPVAVLVAGIWINLRRRRS